jgi:hypothetical protein
VQIIIAVKLQRGALVDTCEFLLSGILRYKGVTTSQECRTNGDDKGPGGNVSTTSARINTK